MKYIYLDHGATTPTDKKVLEVMNPYFSENFGNPMSIHSFGQNAKKAIDKSRQEVTKFLGAQPEEIVFTSGATESNNLTIKGVIEACHNNSRVTKPHIIISAFEHHCILNACQSLEKNGLAEITYLPVYKNGLIKIADLKKAIKQNTLLISIMYVNNEIGTVQPIIEIGKLVKEINKKREIKKQKATNHKLLFHTDATQALNYFDCNVKKLGVDLLSLSGHKIYGPKGIGALYIKKGIIIKPLQLGGEQENNKRAGTHNVPGIVGLGVAIAQIVNHKSQTKKIMSLRDYLIKKVLKEIPNSWLNGDKIKRSPNNINFGFKNVEGESLVLMLDSHGIAASTGSACSSKSLKPSHVLLSLGLKPEEAHGSLRITLGKHTTKKDIDFTIDKLKKSVKKLRQISGKVLEDYYSIV